MPRIAMISEHASPVANLGMTDSGGQNVYVDQVTRGLIQLGYSVDIYTRADDPTRAEPCSWGDNARIIPVRAGPLDAIPKDAIWSYIHEFAESAAELTGRFGPYDLIHGNFWMSGWVGAQIKAQLNIPLVQIFHALGAVKRHHQGKADTSPPERVAIERQVLAAADRVIAQCPAERDELVELYDANPANIRVVPSGVDLDRFYPIPQSEARCALGISPEDRIAVYIGRMLPRKDVANLIEATAILRCRSSASFERFRLLVVGGETADVNLDQEPEIVRLTALAESLGVRDRVDFVGRRPSNALRWYYSAADVFVTTPWYEPYGLTPLEAMACGLPVVCAAVGGITFTVVDGVTGFLVPPRRPDLLAERLDALLGNDHQRAQFAHAARRHVEDQFTWSSVARATAEVYQEVLNHD